MIENIETGLAVLGLSLVVKMVYETLMVPVVAWWRDYKAFAKRMKMVRKAQRIEVETEAVKDEIINVAEKTVGEMKTRVPLRFPDFTEADFDAAAWPTVP